MIIGNKVSKLWFIQVVKGLELTCILLNFLLVKHGHLPAQTRISDLLFYYYAVA